MAQKQKKWLDEGERIVSAILDIVAKTPSLSQFIKQYAKGENLVTEGTHNDSIFLILDGTVQISKSIEDGTQILVMMFQPGDLVGLISFYTEDPAFSSVQAKTAVKAMQFHRAEFHRLAEINPKLYALLQPLIIHNLAERYQRIVQLHVEVALLTRELESERNQLQNALEKLRQTQNRLIHQEKMATLGQLVAGLAHEINNPTASLLRSVDNIIQELPHTQQQIAHDPKAVHFFHFVKIGLDAGFADTESTRKKMEIFEKQYPDLSRTTLRSIAQLSKEGEKLLQTLLAELPPADVTRTIHTAIECYELGTYLRSAKISAERIGNLVGSLKRYGRPAKEDLQLVDIRQGIEDTLLILANRLRKIQVVKNFTEMPLVKCFAGEINQVWTNIILNACEAMEESGKLTIVCGQKNEKEIWVSIQDTGHGIAPEIIPKIFEPNFTTKTATGKFGLGLGLAISNEIVQKHGGTIHVKNVPEGGALFTVTLPLI